jgi:hypothetical protein
MLVVAGVHFPKMHDLRALVDPAETNFPLRRDLFARSIPLTGWGFLYCYPGLEDDPPPDPSDLLAAMVTIDRLVAHMRELIAPARPDRASSFDVCNSADAILGAGAGSE